MLCTPQKMGTGVTLTSASYMIFIDKIIKDNSYYISIKYYQILFKHKFNQNKNEKNNIRNNI